MLQELLERYPALTACRAAIEQAAACWIDCFANGGKLLVCGNGGSCADSDHIVGELMKGFLKKRPLSAAQKQAMRGRCPQLTEAELNSLQLGLPTVALPALTALNTAFCNDADPTLLYAQGVMGLGRPGDVLVGISTSGNSANVLAAAKTAKGLGLTVIGLTGQGGGRLAQVADVCIRVPETETFKVQELHLPVYHYLSAATEAHFYAE